MAKSEILRCFAPQNDTGWVFASTLQAIYQDD